ncbi:MAG: hypothetical protein LBT79_07830 [Elusimicrobiota bacterium]|jgi:hypothetical protein|nr:hypothetical protein [Elusimicrobiota bacterium]
MEKLLDLSSCKTQEDFGKKFEEIAEKLLLEYQIVKDGKLYYYINEIEFYYYCENHKDIYAHPHFYEKDGDFRIHFSGIDITFASNIQGIKDQLPSLYESKNNPTLSYCQLSKAIENKHDARYGGILIRAIEGVNNKTIDGPCVSLCELLHMNASKTVKLELKECKKRNVHYQAPSERELNNNIGDKDSDCFRQAKYRFCISR